MERLTISAQERNRYGTLGRALRLLVISAVIEVLASACVQTSDRPQLPNDREAALAEATRLYGQPVPAKIVGEATPQFVGKTIIVEGFLQNLCDDDSSNACLRSEGRVVVFSDETLPAPPGPKRQPCPRAGVLRGAVLLAGHLPPEFFRRGNRRAVVQGTLAARSVTVPLSMERNAEGVTATIEFDLVLENVTALALYKSRCQ